MVVPVKREKSFAEAVFRRLVEDISRFYREASRAQVKFAWETGRRIVETEQDGQTRALYGSSLIPTLSEDLTTKLGTGFSCRNLWRMRSFYLTEKILPSTAELDWTHHSVLNPVKDKRVRRQLQKRILEEGLTTRELRAIVHETVDKGNGHEPKSAPKLPPLKRPSGLLLGTCSKTSDLCKPLAVKASARPISKKGPLTVLDLGFFVTCAVTREELKAVTVTDTPSYTYGAVVERVVDGDTLKVRIDAGFGIVVHEKLRLRGINTPELGTTEGERAKKFVAGLLPAGSALVLKSHRTQADMFGRFVADIFYNKEATNLEEILAGGVYLNQELLDKGLALRMSE